MRIKVDGKTGLGNLGYDGWVILDKKEMHNAIQITQMLLILAIPHNLAFQGYVL